MFALTSVALASAPYSVKLTVPRYSTAGQTVEVKVTGVSEALSHLAVFVNLRTCPRTVAAETARSLRPLISKNVLGRYWRSGAAHPKPGTYHVCAYLMPIGHSAITRASTSATYYTLVGGY